MSFKPLRNSKGVNKPFRSPFSNVSTPRSDSVKSNPNTPETSTCKLQSRASTSKRLLFQQTTPSKKVHLNIEHKEEVVNANEESQPFASDLEALKKRISEKQESIKTIKTRLLYKRKNKAEDLEAAIEKWTEACQNALRDYQNDLQERYGRSISMAEILSGFNIDQALVRFSAEDETFS